MKKIGLGLILMACAILVVFPFRQQNNTKDFQEDIGNNVVEPVIEKNNNEKIKIAEGSTFEVRYLDVGQADAALIECDGHYMLIDGGNVEDSSLIVAVLKRLGITHLDYIIGTHEHEDHIGGLAGALNVCSVGQVMCSTASYDSKAFNSFVKYTEAQGKEVFIPEVGDSFSLGSSQVTILGPVRKYDDANNNSIVTRIEYGDTSFLFTGDMEREAELDLLDYWDESKIKSTVLKVGHHGSETSTSYPFLRAIEPVYGVISVGKGNSYGHPDEAVTSHLRDAEVKVYRTDEQGDIIILSDGKQIQVTIEKNEVDFEDTRSASKEGFQYIGNLRSHKFHLPTCQSLPAEKNLVYFETREEAIAANYDPCGNCRP